MNAARPNPGDSLMVVGLGGVGMAALLTALSLDGVTVIGVDSSHAKLATAREFGAHETYTPEQVLELGVTATHAVEAAGRAAAFETAFAATSVGGRTVTTGLPAPGDLAAISPLLLTGQARTIIGSYLGSAVPARDIPRYVDLWRLRKLPVEKLMSSQIGLEQINEAMDNLHSGTVLRQIITFD